MPHPYLPLAAPLPLDIRHSVYLPTRVGRAEGSCTPREDGGSVCFVAVEEEDEWVERDDEEPVDADDP